MKAIALMMLGLATTAAAQTTANLGIFEGANDVGTPSHKGSVVYDAAKKEYRLTGGGNNMWAGRDDFFFERPNMEGLRGEAIADLRAPHCTTGRGALQPASGAKCKARASSPVGTALVDVSSKAVAVLLARCASEGEISSLACASG